MFQQTGVAERIISAAGFVAQNTRNQPDDCVNDQHRRDFSTIADEVAHRNLSWLQTLTDPVIKTFVPSTEQQQSRLLSEFLNQLLIQFSTLRGHHQ